MSRITFSGLASGLDTNSLIDQLVQLERQPIVRKEKRIEKLETVKDTWRDVNMRLNNLRATLQLVKDQENFQSMQVESTNPSLVSAQAQVGAEPASYELQVHQVATNHTISMVGGVGDVNEALGLNGVFSIKDLTSAEEELVEIQVQGTDSLAAIRNKINDAGAGVTASIIAGHLVLKSNETGAANEIELAHVSGQNIIASLGLNAETVAAQDALISINGITVTRSSNSVDDLIENVTFNIFGETAEPVYLQVGADTERAMEALGTFVEQYNSVNEFIREKLEKREPDAAGTRGLLQGDTTLIKIERALRSLVSSPVSNARFQDEDGNWQQKKYSSLSSLGVTTIDKDGFLQFDANKLAVALQDDPQAVFEMMQFELKDEEGVGTGSYSGVAVELDNYLKRLLMTEYDSQGRPMQAIAVQQEAAVQRRIDEMHRRIDMREERLLRYEERLVRQFTALETYISTMQSQGQDLQNMIGQMTGFGGGKN